MPPLTTAAVLLGAGLFAQPSPDFVNVACNDAFALTRPPLSALIGPTGARCIEITGWGDSARAILSGGGGGGGGSVVLDAISVTLRGEGPEVMLFRQRQLTGAAMTGELRMRQYRLGSMPAFVSELALSQVLVQSVSTLVTVDGTATSILLQPGAATWRAWRINEIGEAVDPIEFTRDFTAP
jgi:hypothetical protein